MLTPTRLRQAVALAEHGSFRRAARTLGISQPALTRGVQALEASLGVPLFDRRSNSVTLTAFGRLVIDRARAMIMAEADLRRDIALMQGLETGSVSIALGPYPSVISCYSAAARLVAEHPKLGITLHVANWRDVTIAVAEGRVDLGVAELFDAVLNEALDAEVVGQHHSRVFCRPGHPILARRRVALPDLLQFPWVATRVPPRLASKFPRPPGRAGMIDELTGAFVPAIELDVPMQLAEFGRDSDALLFGVFGLVERELESGALVFVPTPGFDLRTSYGFIRMKDRSPSPGTRAFMEAVRAQEALCVERETRLQKAFA